MMTPEALFPAVIGYVSFHVCACAHVCEFGGQRLTLGVFLNFSTLFVETESVTEPGDCLIWLDQPASKP